MSDKLSRRDFLKVSAVALGTMALAKPAETLSKAELEVERTHEFKTDEAAYIPFYEDHRNRDSDKRIIKSNSDYLFLEMASPAYIATLIDSKDLLTMEGGTESGSRLSKKYVSTGRFISKELLQDMVNTGSGVVFEGVALPDNLERTSEILENTISIGSGLFLGSKIAPLLKKSWKDEKITKSDSKNLLKAVLINTLANSNQYATLGLNSYQKKYDEEKVNKARHLAARFNALATLTHPEDLQVFMRNIFTSLKLILIAEQNPKGTKNKPRISFRIGAGHSAVTDIVQMGRGVTTSLLEIYSKETLRQVIEYNIQGEEDLEEKIKKFSSTVYVPVREVMETGADKQILFDEKLANYLTERLVEK